MVETKNKLRDRIKDRFFGAKATKGLKHLSSSQMDLFLREALSVYQRALSYLEKWYDYENSLLKKLTVLNLKSDQELIYEDFVCAAKILHASVDEDKLYDEQFILGEHRTLDQKWSPFFSGCKAPNLHSIVVRMLVIPVSNGFVERTFSLMNNLWTDNRNHMRVDLVKADLCVQVIFGITCSTFFEYLCHQDQESLLKAAMSNSKYNFSKH